MSGNFNQWNNYSSNYFHPDDHLFYHPAPSAPSPKNLPNIQIDTSTVHAAHPSYAQGYVGQQHYHTSPDSEFYHGSHNPFSPSGQAFHPIYRNEPFSPSSADTSSSSGQSSSSLFMTMTSPIHGSPPSTPSSQYSHLSPEDESPRQIFSARAVLAASKRLYSYKEQTAMFRQAHNLPTVGPPGPFVPQTIYKPHTESDQRRYVEEVELEEPIKFWIEGSSPACGVSVEDALLSRTKQLQCREETVFEGRGPSVSIRINWPGYRPWTKQIPTRDFRKIPGPITRSKLAKGIAKCIKTFISEKSKLEMEEDSDPRWRVGPGFITIDDIMVISVHHVSMGSWQPQLRLKRTPA